MLRGAAASRGPPSRAAQGGLQWCDHERPGPPSAYDRIPAGAGVNSHDLKSDEQKLMLSGDPRLCEIEPRERVGAQTGRKYEYQYERTARAALDLLADGASHVCV